MNNRILAKNLIRDHKITFFNILLSVSFSCSASLSFSNSTLNFVNLLVRILSITRDNTKLKIIKASIKTWILFNFTSILPACITMWIGKTLILSPPFPPIHTVRATFIAYGVPSRMTYSLTTHNSQREFEAC